jgi:hypothetical protein
MLYLDLPTPAEIAKLGAVRADACVSIYLESSPLTQETPAHRIELRNLIKEARAELERSGLDKRRLAALIEHLDDLGDDDELWRRQTNSLAILATPDFARTFRLANRLATTMEVSDRFHLKPLLRAITFPHTALILAISENDVRLVEVSADLPPQVVRAPDLPKDAASAVGKSTLNDRSHDRRIVGSEGQNVRFRQYARKVDAALRPVLAGRDAPMILAGAGRIPSVYRSVNSYPHLLPQGIDASPDRMSEADLAAAARPILDAAYRDEVACLNQLYTDRFGEGRATSDLSDAARAATFGAVDSLLVDMDAVVPGEIDERTGAVTFADRPGAESYSVTDEIARRALSSGARVLAVRKDDLPAGGELAAILRYKI